MPDARCPWAINLISIYVTPTPTTTPHCGSANSLILHFPGRPGPVRSLKSLSPEENLAAEVPFPSFTCSRDYCPQSSLYRPYPPPLSFSRSSEELLFFVGRDKFGFLIPGSVLSYVFSQSSLCWLVKTSLFYFPNSLVWVHPSPRKPARLIPFEMSPRSSDR